MGLVKRLLTLAVVLVVSTAPLRAELRYTMRIESQRSAEPAAPAANPLLALIGGMILSTLAPPGGVDITVTMGERGSRVEYSQPYAAVPAGGVLLSRPDGSIVVLDPSSKTFWRQPKLDLSDVKPELTVTRTGEKADVAGVPTERATLDLRVPIPVPAGQLPPGIPAFVVLRGETWLAERYKQYATITTALGGVFSIGLDRLSAEGMPMKSVLRGDLFGDQQIASTITTIAEVAAAPADFEIPPGFTEKAPPSSIPGIARP